MIATLILWSHALAALLYGLLAGWTLRQPQPGMPRRLLAAALSVTALWALAAAGIGLAEAQTRLADGAASLAWLGLMARLQRPRCGLAPGAIYTVAALVIVAATLLGLGTSALPAPLAAHVVAATYMLRILAAIAALVLVQILYSTATPRPPQTILLALAGIWLVDFNIFSVAWLAPDFSLPLAAARGTAMALIAIGIAIGMQRRQENSEWEMQVSRTVAWQVMTLIAIGLYFALLALATSLIAAVGGNLARVLQTAFVFGSTATILTLVSTPWLRAWTRVKLAKHFFRHRYDYRTEWLRFTGTLGTLEGAARLDERIVKAIADLTDSPAGLLLTSEGSGPGQNLELSAAWNWHPLPAAGSDNEALAHHLATSGRIVELDMVRAGAAAVDAAATPDWIRALAPAWVLVPLSHLGQLTGMILLARPPVPHALDWEDFDLLKVAGQQAASYLAEARAQETLAEAERFDEFNRRFAFILHDIKNLVSQLALLAHNAERHADNPAFHADMIATLKESAGRMNGLLARLSQHHRAQADPSLRPTAIAPLLHSLATEQCHPVTVEIHCEAMALADPDRLEQLLRQLLQNAIDASAPDVPVTLALDASVQEARIDVIDRGCGMSPGFIRDKLFKPFVSSKPGGFGIGVFEARQLATTMGGRIEVNSREGQGSRFRVVLPVAEPQPFLYCNEQMQPA